MIEENKLEQDTATVENTEIMIEDVTTVENTEKIELPELPQPSVNEVDYEKLIRNMNFKPSQIKRILNVDRKGARKVIKDLSKLSKEKPPFKGFKK